MLEVSFVVITGQNPFALALFWILSCTARYLTGGLCFLQCPRGVTVNDTNFDKRHKGEKRLQTIHVSSAVDTTTTA